MKTATIPVFGTLIEFSTNKEVIYLFINRADVQPITPVPFSRINVSLRFTCVHNVASSYRRVFCLGLIMIFCVYTSLFISSLTN